MAEGTQYRALSSLAETNPETLTASTPADELLRYVDLSATQSGTIDWNSIPELRFSEAPSRARRVVKPGDVLFGTVRPNLQSHGFVDAQRWRLIVASTGFSVIRAKEGIGDGRYLYHCVLSEQVRRQANRDAVGSNYPAVNDSDVQRFNLFAPSVLEQSNIARVLDTLDTAIHQTEVIIAKLKQVKQGLLHDLLTRGIDANGELRPPQSQASHLYKSSLLGWIPVGWQVRELVSCVQKIADRDHTTPRYVREGVLMVSPVNLSDDEWIDFEHAKRISARDHAVNRKKTDLEPGDLIIHRIGAGLGQVRLISSKMPTFSILHSMAQIRPNPATMSGRFMLWALRDTRVQVQIEHGTQSIGVPDLGLDKIGALQIVVPELTEQRLISAALNSLQAKIHACNVELHKAKLTKLGLMDDLLTGRVRVTPLLKVAAAS